MISGFYFWNSAEILRTPWAECAPTANTETAYRFEIVAKIPYFPLGATADQEASHIWAKIRAYGSSAMLPRGDSYCVGDFATGIPIANYGGTGRANLDAWRKADLSELSSTAPETQPSPADFDFREWATEAPPPHPSPDVLLPWVLRGKTA